MGITLCFLLILCGDVTVQKLISNKVKAFSLVFTEQEHDLVALIPVRDRRLKPRRM